MTHWEGGKAETKKEKNKEMRNNGCTTYLFTMGAGQASFMEIISKYINVVPQNTLSARMAFGRAVKAHW